MNHDMVAGADCTRHHVVRGGRRLPRIMASPIVFGALASAYLIGFGPSCFIGFGPLYVIGFGRKAKPSILDLINIAICSTLFSGPKIGPCCNCKF